MFYRRELKVFDAIQKQIHTRVSPNYNIKNFDCSDGIITDDTLYLLTYSKFLFIHIPKTAGIALRTYFDKPTMDLVPDENGILQHDTIKEIKEELPYS